MHVLMDCEGNIIDCNHPTYGKEQNIGLHDVIDLVVMTHVTMSETYDIDGNKITAKVDHTYSLFCPYLCSSHQALNNHIQMHFQAILMCGWRGCYFVHIQSKKMIEHSSKEHNMV